jgi:hypothetical protein
MAKKATVDINTLFVANTFTTSEMITLSRSELFPVVIAAYNATGGALKCGPSSGGDHLLMCTNEGVPALEVGYGSDFRKGKQIALRTTRGMTPDRTNEIESSRVPYIVSQIKKERGADIVNNALQNAEDFYAKFIMRLINDSKDNQFSRADSRVSINLSDTDVWELTKMVAEGTGVSSLPTASYQSIVSAYHKHQERVHRMKKQSDDFTDFWSRDKWVMLIDPYNTGRDLDRTKRLDKGGFMLLKLSGERMRPVVSDYLGRDYPSHQRWRDAITPVGWVRGIPDAIQDPELRAALLPSLMMYKVHTANDPFLGSIDGGFIKVYTEIGAVYHEGNWAMVSVLVFE